MPANNRRRKIKQDAVGRFLIKETGGTNEGGSSRRKAIKAASEFHPMPHLFQAAPAISDFISGDPKATKVKSILERNTLDEFLDCSLASQALYDKQNAVRVLVKQSDRQMRADGVPYLNTVVEASGSVWQKIIPIPKRPINYVSGKPETILNPSELSKLESEAFLKWRLKLSKIEEQEGRIMTPFERNLEFWRQLWRVLERSDVVIQILDARNPLFFRSKALENYVKEIHASKEVILLLNKSDLVPQHVRITWARWFRSHGVACLFFSALDELMRQGVLLDDMEGNLYDELSKANKKMNSDRDSVESGEQDEEEEEVEKLPVVEADEEPNNANEASIRDQTTRLEQYTEVLSDLITDRVEGEMFENYIWRISENADVLNATQLLAVLRNIRDILSTRFMNEYDNCLESIHEEEKVIERCEKINEAKGEQSDPDEEKDIFDNYTEEESEENEGSCLSITKVNQVKNHRYLGEETKTFLMRRDPDPAHFVIGLVGYPNVGKSSLINSLLGHKVVSVSRQPGKTKHFQTLPLPSVGLTLCDCPGLVFPQIVSTKAHLVTNGVSSIDHVRRDFVAPIQIVCDSISIPLLKYYNLDFNLLTSKHSKPAATKIRHISPEQKPEESQKISTGPVYLDATQFLSLLAKTRGYISGGKGGLPDLFQTAKYVLRDFTSGKLLHWVLPPVSVLNREAINNASVIQTDQVTVPAIHSTTSSRTSTIHHPKDDDDDNLLLDFLNHPTSFSSTNKPMTRRGQRKLQKQMIKSRGVHSVSNHGDTDSNTLSVSSKSFKEGN